MKNGKRIITVLVVTVLISIIAGYVAGFFAYKEYKEKIAYFDKVTIERFGELEENLKNLYLTLENSVAEGKLEREKVLSKIEAMKEDMRAWEGKSEIKISELKGSIEDLKLDRLVGMVENLQDDIDEFKMTVQDLELRDKLKSVDLGKIAVEKKIRDNR